MIRARTPSDCIIVLNNFLLINLTQREKTFENDSQVVRCVQTIDQLVLKLARCRKVSIVNQVYFKCKIFHAN